jgi:small subunit ribosomal protein S1
MAERSKPAAPGAPSARPSESFASLFEQEGNRAPSRRSFMPGDELDVTVVQVGRDAVFVELDGKQEGFIESKDLAGKGGEVAVKVGSRIKSRVVEVGGRPGAVRLVPLLVRPPEDDASDEAPVAVDLGFSASAAAGGPVVVGSRVKGTVAAVERYGVFVELAQGGAGRTGRRGVRGLVPVAELGVPRGADLHRMFPLGTELETKVIAIDDRGRIKLSVVALHADAERREFEVFEQKTRGNQGPAPSRTLGTLGDLLKKK